MRCGTCKIIFRINRRNISGREKIIKCYSCINNNVKCINIFYEKKYLVKCLNTASKKNNNFCRACIKKIRNMSKCLKCNVICWSPVRDIYNGYNYIIDDKKKYNDICCMKDKSCIKNNIIKNILPIMGIVLKKNTIFHISIIIFEMLCSKKDMKWTYDNAIYDFDLKEIFINLIN